MMNFGKCALAALASAVALGGSTSIAAEPAGGGAYGNLIRTFHETETLENEAFEKLVFVPSPTKLSRSINFKLVLRDQLGRDWLFKAGKSAAIDGAVAVYRLFHVFGLATPEIHYKTLRINEEEVPGTLQRYLANEGTFQTAHLISSFASLSPAVLEYVAKNHVMSWLAANHQVHPDQFLVLSRTEGKVQSAVRIDNAVEWFLLGSDRLDLDYRSPMTDDTPYAGYGPFWRFYIFERILTKEGRRKSVPEEVLEMKVPDSQLGPPKANIDLARLYNWGAFIAGFPEKEYLRFFERGLANGCRNFSNETELTAWIRAPELLLEADPAKVRPRLLARKRTLKADLRKFYARIARATGEIPKLEAKPASAAVAAELIERLNQDLADRRKDLEALKGGQAKQETISLPLSFRGHQAVLTLAKLWSDPLHRRFRKVMSVTQVLEHLESSSNNSNEKAALGAALENLRVLTDCLGRKGQDLNPLLHIGRLFRKGWILPTCEFVNHE